MCGVFVLSSHVPPVPRWLRVAKCSSNEPTDSLFLSHNMPHVPRRPRVAPQLAAVFEFAGAVGLGECGVRTECVLPVHHDHDHAIHYTPQTNAATPEWSTNL